MGRNKILVLLGILAIIVVIIMLILFRPTPGPGPGPELPAIPAMPMSTPVSQGEQSLTLHIGWNMVSMPETTNKTDVYFTYNNESYNWTEAIDIPLIPDDLRSYNGSEYVEVDVLLKNKGYWLYAFVEPLYISSDPQVIYCKKIYYDGNETINCTRLVISPYYETEIHCKSINADEVCFYFYNVGEIP